jgi:hypothetical protein
MSEKINCALITVCSRTDEYGYEMLKKSVDKFNWPFYCLKTEWKGFGTKLITTYQFLKSDEANDITHFFFCDAYDVVVLGTMDEAISKIEDKSKIVVGAERGLWPPDLQVHDSKFEHFDHGFNYVNSGLYFAPKEVFIGYFEVNKPEYSTDDQKWLTETYLNQKNDNIVLDNNCNVFQNYSFLKDNDYDYGFTRLINKNTDTQPVFVHGNGRTDLTKVYELINGKPKISDLNIYTDLIEKINNQPWQTVPSKKYCMDLASKIPYNTLDELICNAEKIQKYLTESI